MEQENQKTKSQLYAERMTELYGPEWRQMFVEYGKKATTRPFRDDKGLARRAALRAREVVKEKYGEDFYDRMWQHAQAKRLAMRKAPSADNASNEQPRKILPDVPDRREEGDKGIAKA